MRPQQNRRMRGRGNNNSNNNRKGPNPLTRSYESNGPDVKIRGTAQQIAEKYATLARDAQSSGDRVMAENYLQHAEHYNRIIMTAQAQLQAQQPRPQRDDDDGFDERDDGGDTDTVNEEARETRQPVGSGPQPVIEGTPAELAPRSGGEQPQRRERSRDNRRSRDDEQGGETSQAVNGQSHQSADQPESVEAGQPADEQAEEAAPRRVRRPRRPRQAQAVEGDGDATSPGETVSEAAE